MRAPIRRTPYKFRRSLFKFRVTGLKFCVTGLVFSLLSLSILSEQMANAAPSDTPQTFLAPAFNGQNGSTGVGVIFDDSQAALSYSSGLGDTNVNSKIGRAHV